MTNQIQILVAEYNIHGFMGSITPMNFVSIENLPLVLETYQKKMNESNRFPNLKYTLFLYILIPNQDISPLSDLVIDVSKDKILNNYDDSILCIKDVIQKLQVEYNKLIL